MSNPIDGAHYQLDRLKSEFNSEGDSFRDSECVTNWRHAVPETDDTREALRLKALVLLELPIVAVYHSRGRGAHALINLSASTPKSGMNAWLRIVNTSFAWAHAPEHLTPVRLSRLPNCMRQQTGRLQQLLYLAPQADDTPIAKRPLREDPSAVSGAF